MKRQFTRLEYFSQPQPDILTRVFQSCRMLEDGGYNALKKADKSLRQMMYASRSGHLWGRNPGPCRVGTNNSQSQ
jgi:hypothetical protein